MDANNVTVDTFSHMPNTQRENANAIFTSEKLGKSEEMSDALKYLTINDAKYYESDTATTSDSQGGPSCDQKTVTQARNRNEKVTHTSNGGFEPKVLNNRTIPVVFPKMNPRIDQRIALIVVVP